MRTAGDARRHRRRVDRRAVRRHPGRAPPRSASSTCPPGSRRGGLRAPGRARGAQRHADAEVASSAPGCTTTTCPAIVDAIIQRSEFLTPYTPYQPEVSQGGLQVMFEFQTAISELTGLPVANASVYEGPSSVAAAGYLAKLENRARASLVISRGVHPHSRAALAPTRRASARRSSRTALDDGATDVDALAARVDDDTAAVFVQQPNFLGTVEDLGPLAAAAKRTGALLVVAGRPAHARNPASRPASAARTSASARASRSATGSTSAARRSASSPPPRAHPPDARPDRGRDRDVDGRRGFVLTLQTREQHIRREKATHNICTVAGAERARPAWSTCPGSASGGSSSSAS